MLLRLRQLMLEFRKKSDAYPEEVEVHPKVWMEILSTSNSSIFDWPERKVLGMKLIENPKMDEDGIVVR